MSVKRYLTLAAAGIASIAATSAIAGGPDVMAAPMDYSGFYLDLDAGWGGSNWNHFAGGVLDPFNPSIGSVTDHGTGGFAWGGDVGYQFNQYFSVEMGAYDLASVRGNNGIILGNAASVGGVKINSWVLYAAGKVAIPVMQNFDFFGKVGVAWRFLNYSGVGVSGAAAIAAGINAFVNDRHYASPLFGFGMQYWFTSEWSINAQYLRIAANADAGFRGPGFDANASAQAPAVDLVVAGVGYKFSS